MGIFSPVKEGSWTLSSKSDPRWNTSGRGLVGGFEMPEECKNALEELKKKLGEDPPEDLEWEYMKD